MIPTDNVQSVPFYSELYKEILVAYKAIQISLANIVLLYSLLPFQPITLVSCAAFGKS